MPVRTKLLAVGSVTAPGQKPVYTVPAGSTAIAKRVIVTSYFTVPQVVEWLGGPPSGARWILMKRTVQPQVPEHLETWTVFPGGWIMYLNTGAVGEMYYWVSGTELEGEDLPLTIPSFGASVGVLPAPS